MLAGAAILVGCTTVKLAYEGAPSLTYFWIDSYLDLDDAQTPKVKEELAALHQWHRRNELPLYADLLHRAARMAPGEVPAREACAVYDEMRERFVALAGRAEPAAAQLVLSITPEQIRHLERKYADNNRKYRKEWIDVSASERHRLRYKQLLERSEDFYGRLDAAQRAAMRERTESSVFDPQIMLAERMRRQRDALQTLARLQAERPAAAEARQQIRAWLERSLTSPDAAYRAYEHRLRDETCQTFAAAHATASAAQREKARVRLLAYEKDLRDLAQR